ncbi:TorD/DmsD family molecular chaperone [Oceanospirillum sp.]|uniref:TorD/DmsD family molecular chaperone n=1 Tax=Oceanospirillum sp. TaxID=2021254 RepID=UPI003A9449DD
MTTEQNQAIAQTNISEPAIGEHDLMRADIYNLLAALLRSVPSPEMVQWLKELETDQHDGSDMGKAWSGLQLAARHAQTEQLEDEYQQLFIGLGRGELVPYGSWYLTGSLMETPLAILRQDLKLLGFEREERVKEPEDHAAALFEVMAFLIMSGSGSTTQKSFYERHLAEWIGRFFRDLQQAESAVFYSSIGTLGRAFTDFETDSMAAIKEQAIELQ